LFHFGFLSVGFVDFAILILELHTREELLAGGDGQLVLAREKKQEHVRDMRTDSRNQKEPERR
jgi:hypothetical protein